MLTIGQAIPAAKTRMKRLISGVASAHRPSGRERDAREGGAQAIVLAGPPSAALAAIAAMRSLGIDPMIYYHHQISRPRIQPDIPPPGVLMSPDLI